MKNHSPKAPTIHNSFDNNGSNVRVKIIANLHGNLFHPIVTIIHQNSVYKLRCDLGWGDADSSCCSFNTLFKIHLKDATWKQKIQKNTSYHCGHKMNFIRQLQVRWSRVPGSENYGYYGPTLLCDQLFWGHNSGKMMIAASIEWGLSDRGCRNYSGES